jgi:RNA 3'-terminal phosphate cyclase
LSSLPWAFGKKSTTSWTNLKKKGPPPGVVTATVQKQIIEPFKKGLSPDQIALDSIVKEVHLTEKEVSCIVEEYDASKVSTLWIRTSFRCACPFSVTFDFGMSMQKKKRDSHNVLRGGIEYSSY